MHEFNLNKIGTAMCLLIIVICRCTCVYIHSWTYYEQHNKCLTVQLPWTGYLTIICVCKIAILFKIYIGTIRIFYDDRVIIWNCSNLLMFKNFFLINIFMFNSMLHRIFGQLFLQYFNSRLFVVSSKVELQCLTSLLYSVFLVKTYLCVCNRWFNDYDNSMQMLFIHYWQWMTEV